MCFIFLLHWFFFELSVVCGITSCYVMQHHTCAVLVGWAARCWGSNDNGQVRLFEMCFEATICLCNVELCSYFFCSLVMVLLYSNRHLLELLV